MSPIDSFIIFFNNIDLISLSLWILGLVLFSVEFFRGSSLVMYTLGTAFFVSSFIVRMLHGSPGEAFMYVVFTFIVIFALHTISVVLNRRDWLKVARMRKTDVTTNKYQNLVGKIGVATAPIDRVGNIVIDDINLVVYSETPIERGESVRITEIKTDKIIVERV